MNKGRNKHRYNKHRANKNRMNRRIQRTLYNNLVSIIHTISYSSHSQTQDESIIRDMIDIIKTKKKWTSNTAKLFY